MHYEFTATILSLKRLNNSVNGNPAYLVTFDNGEARRTQSDGSVAYSIPNPEFRGVPVEVYTSRAGRIVDVRVHKG